MDRLLFFLLVSGAFMINKLYFYDNNIFDCQMVITDNGN